jgi:hypothetical protein
MYAPQKRKPAWQRAPEITLHNTDAMLCHCANPGNQAEPFAETEADLPRAARRAKLAWWVYETRTGTRYLLAPRRGRPDPASVRQFDSLAAALEACRAPRLARSSWGAKSGHEY